MAKARAAEEWMTAQVAAARAAASTCVSPTAACCATASPQLAAMVAAPREAAAPGEEAEEDTSSFREPISQGAWRLPCPARLVRRPMEAPTERTQVWRAP